MGTCLSGCAMLQGCYCNRSVQNTKSTWQVKDTLNSQTRQPTTVCMTSHQARQGSITCSCVSMAARFRLVGKLGIEFCSMCSHLGLSTACMSLYVSDAGHGRYAGTDHTTPGRSNLPLASQGSCLHGMLACSAASGRPLFASAGT